MISVKDIYKNYDNNNVLNGITFDIKKGSLVGIAGKNGSGKSTLLKIIANITKPTKGDLTIDQKSIIKNPNIAKKYIGYVSQENSLFLELTVKDNIKFFSSLLKLPFDTFDLSNDILNEKLKNLSGGVRKRINILISLINEPNYLILDEPTANLDLYYKNEVLKLISDYIDKGKTVIVASHDSDVLFKCDVLHVINGGKLVFCDSPNKLAKKEFFESKLYEIIKN